LEPAKPPTSSAFNIFLRLSIPSEVTCYELLLADNIAPALAERGLACYLTETDTGLLLTQAKHLQVLSAIHVHTNTLTACLSTDLG
jgi:hypothetical protein